MYRWLLMCLLTCNLAFSTTPSEHPRVLVYETTGGRFGDNLLSYIHAKYIGYITKLPVLYTPFAFSNQLKLSELEMHATKEVKRLYRHQPRLRSNRHVSDGDPRGTCYLVPYFPDSHWEREHCLSYDGGKWDVLPMNWNDPGFQEELRRVICPKEAFNFPALPEDRITVAVHVRRGGNHDGQYHYLNPGFPLKFIPISQVIQEIRMLRELLDDAPLYARIFTDDNNPPEVMKKFVKEFRGVDIVFECRESGNCDTKNVVYDFFHMMEFDCLIHSESNYSYIPSRMGDFMVTIAPKSFKRQRRKFIYPDHRIIVNRDHPKFPR